MKTAIRFSFAFALLSCGSADHGGTEAQQSTAVQSLADTSHPAGPVVDSVLAGKPYAYWLTNEKIAKEARELLAARSDVSINENVKAWKLADLLLREKDTSLAAVYFYAFTRTLKKSDGAYAETAGKCCHDYPQENPVLFCRFFATEPLLRDDDLKAWTTFAFSEIQIACEGKEDQCIQDYLHKLEPAGKKLQDDPSLAAELRIYQETIKEIIMARADYNRGLHPGNR
jgi:hypothetical protein